MTRQLTVHNATIQTAAVEVKTLTISGKQVTLAVFRQLREEQLISNDGTLNGQPWGFVNYHPDKCETSQFTHLHVIWQRKDELLRSRVNDIPDFDTGGRDDDGARRHVSQAFYSAEANWYLTSRACSWLSGEIDQIPLEVNLNYSGPNSCDPWRYFDFQLGFRAAAKASPAAMEAVAARLRLEREEAKKLQTSDSEWAKQFNADQQARLEAAAKTDREATAALQEELSGWPNSGLQQTGEAFKRATAAESARRQRHRELRKSLTNLPQLFIAV